MKLIVLLLMVVLTLSVTAQNSLNIVPMPAEVKINKGIFSFSPSTVIVIKNGVDDYSADIFNNYLKAKFGFKLKKVKSAQANYIQLTTLQTLVPGKDGAYSLNVNPKNIIIYGQTASGTFYGVQTLMQLLPVEAKKSFPPVYNITAVEINDEPRFKYRGMHLDVGRHFMPVDFIKKYIDYLALHKFNNFHWHLTEDQGWRIEIKKYPLLTQVGSCRAQTLIGRYGSNKYDGKKDCGFYTQQQIKDIVKYAADRYITIIPEIEMPGHSVAALASYPYLGCTKGPYKVHETWGVTDDVFCAGNDSTFTFLQNVLDEVLQLFPGKYIHIGGDESPKERWKVCPACQKRITDNHLKDEHALQSYFINRIEKYLNSKGRNIIGWDEILEGGLAPNATVMSWRGEEGGIEAAKQNHDVIMTPGTYCYLNYSQTKNEDSVTIGGYLPLETVYGYEPVPAALNAEQAKHVLGAQGNVWTEYINNTSILEYMIFPRMSALSEVLWSPKEKKDWKDFERRLPVIFKMYESWKANYSKAYYDLKATVLPTEDYNGVLWQIESKKENSSIRVNYWNSNKTIKMNVDSIINGEHWNVLSDFYMKDSIIYTSPLKIKTTGFYEAIFLDKRNNKLVQIGNPVKQRFSFNKATGKKITIINQPSKSYPGDGAFTLVNGMQNEKGLAKSSEFLGFNGTDLDATIDLGREMNVSKVTLHVLSQNGSWIYLPAKVEIQYLPFIETDSKFSRLPPTVITSVDVKQEEGINKIEIKGEHNTRYIRVVAKNFGIIPSGNAGAGNQAWLFVDEIEVE